MAATTHPSYAIPLSPLPSSFTKRRVRDRPPCANEKELLPVVLLLWPDQQTTESENAPRSCIRGWMGVSTRLSWAEKRRPDSSGSGQWEGLRMPVPHSPPAWAWAHPEPRAERAAGARAVRGPGTGRNQGARAEEQNNGQGGQPGPRMRTARNLKQETGRGKRHLTTPTEFSLSGRWCGRRKGWEHEEPGQAWTVWGAPPPSHMHGLRVPGPERTVADLVQILSFFPVRMRLWGRLPSFYRKRDTFSHT